MNVNLTPHLEAMIREKVESGRYNNASEVVREALRLLEMEDRIRLERLRAALKVGLDELERGEGREYTPEVATELWENARRKHREGHRPNPDVLP